MSDYKELEAILAEMETELAKLGLWDVPEPEARAFESASPFFLDTMELHEWLRYVLIKKLRALMAASEKLREKAEIFPYAYEFYHEDRSRYLGLLRSIHRLDSFFRKREQR